MSKPRRTRYTVEATKGQFGQREKFDFLAMSETSGRAFLSRKGYRIHSFITAAQAVAQKQNAGWRKSLAGLTRARQELGITLPILIKQTSRIGDQQGIHSLHLENGKLHHHIIVKSYLTPEEATEVLWHELTHAAQAERAAAKVVRPEDFSALSYRVKTAWTAEQIHQRDWPYSRRPIEREANENMRKFAHIPLAIRG